MEIRSDEPQTSPLTHKELLTVKRKWAGIVLSDQEIINMVSGPLPQDLDTQVKWYNAGSTVNRFQTPNNRLGDIIERNFTNLSLEDKRKLLVRAFIWSFSRIPYQYWYSPNHSAPLGPEISSKITRKTVGEILIRSLEVTGGDIQAARQLLTSTPFTKERGEDFAHGALYLLFFDPENTKLMDKYKQLDPHIPQLAFWLYADLDQMSPFSKRFDLLLNAIFPEVNANLKTEIMIFVKEQFLAGKIPKGKYKDIRLFLARHQQLYQGLKQSHPDLPFVQAFEDIQKTLRLDELLGKTKGGKIIPEDLVNLLKQSPQMIESVTEDELQKTRDAAGRDHHLAWEIEEIIRRKQKQEID